jgi:hypothetical protein
MGFAWRIGWEDWAGDSLSSKIYLVTWVCLWRDIHSGNMLKSAWHAWRHCKIWTSICAISFTCCDSALLRRH